MNDTAVPIPSVNLSSTNDIFHFDGDGICSHGFTPFVGSSYCTNGNVTTGYEGPINTFSGYTSSDGYTTGVVNFDALAPGASTFFSLESSLSGVSFIIPADFSVTKSVTSRGPYYAGDASTPITYRLAAHNFGGVSGPVPIRDTVPTATTIVTGSDVADRHLAADVFGQLGREHHHLDPLRRGERCHDRRRVLGDAQCVHFELLREQHGSMGRARLRD